MAVNVKCPSCGTLASVDDGQAGKPFQCGRCGTRLALRTHTPETRVTQGGAAGTASTQMPTQIGGFAVRRVLGSGAFGTVYLGHDHALDRPVALKAPHAHAFATPRARKRFETEARALAQLRHPHIVPVYAAGFDGEHYYIASQFIAGPAKDGAAPKAVTLEEAIEAGGLGFKEAAETMRDLADALDYAHDLGIVHRDVKPANVLLDAHGRVHLADFGLAHQESSAEKLTHDGAILGTPAYMAPEQAKGREADVLPASDQYSLGIVLYELLAGQVPFSGPVGLVLSLHQNEEPRPPSRLRPRVPRDLETICLKAMAKDPKKRYASCGLMAADLRRWLEGEPIRARRMGPLEAAARWVRRNPLVAALTAAVAASLVLGTVVAGSNALEADRQASAARQNLRDMQAQKERADGKTLEARANADAAAKNAQEARNAAALADQNAAEARKNANAARESEKQAVAAQKKAEESEAAASRNLYLARMQIARGAWGEHNIAGVEAALEAARPTPGGADLRHFEWFFYHNLLGRPLLPKNDAPVLAVSGDGKRVATGDGRTPPGVWDADSGALVCRLECDDKPDERAVHNLVFTPGGDRVVGANRTFRAPVWDARTGRRLFELVGHAAEVGGIAVSGDGKLLATASTDHTVRLWEADTGKPVRTLKAMDEVGGVALSADGKYVAGASPKGPIAVWDAGDGRELATASPVNDPGMPVFSPDGRGILSRSGKLKEVLLWDPATGKELLRFGPVRAPIISIACSPDGKRITAGTNSGEVIVWDALIAKQLFSFHGHDGGARAWYVAGGLFLATTGPDGRMRTWPAEPGADAGVRLEASAAPVVDLAFDPAGERLTGVAADGTVLAWNPAQPGKFREVIHAPATIKPGLVSYAPGPDLVALGTSPVEVAVREAATGKERFVNMGGVRTRAGMAFSPDGSLLAVAGYEGPEGGKSRFAFSVWDVQAGRRACNKPYEEKGPFLDFPGAYMVFSRDGKRVAASGSDVLIMDAATGDVLHAIRQDRGALAFSPDGKWLAGGGHNGVVKVWDAASGEELFQLGGHTDAIQSLAFSPDGKRLASGSADHTIRLWDMASRQEVIAVEAHEGGVAALAFSPDGRKLASASDDKTVKLWLAPAAP